MSVTRRELLAAAGLGAAVGTLGGLSGCRERGVEAESPGRPRRNRNAGGENGEWAEVREQFRLDPELVHLSALFISSHPEPVREAMARHRQALDENPAGYLQGNNTRLERQVRQAAARYLGAQPNEIALTDSTTMGLGLVYNGLQVREGQELLTSEIDYYSTRESLRFKAQRSGAEYREVRLYRDVQAVTADEIVDTLMGAVTSETRVVAVTWVHSSTGLKVPVRRIAEALGEANRGRDPAERALLCVDGVHGLGVESASMGDLGCDFFMAGTHKWMFGPRGTGIVWGNPRSQALVTPTIPTFTSGAGWGGVMTPGGFKAFEHRWAMTETFEFHRGLGKERIEARTHALARQLKEGLAEMPHVRLYTPLDEELSAGIVCFDVGRMTPGQVVRRLRDRRIIGTTTPYSPSHARLTPAIFNTPEEIDRALAAIRALG
jgi:isopenicillin-N epimerase